LRRRKKNATRAQDDVLNYIVNRHMTCKEYLKKNATRLHKKRKIVFLICFTSSIDAD